ASHSAAATVAPVKAVPVRPVETSPVAAMPAAPVAAPVGNPSIATGPPLERPSDPIDEAPNAVWYVRPPSGGQYGPASGDIMRRWLTEGRVSADSLIWREGWPDWKTAAGEFRQLAGASPAAVGFGAPATGGAAASPTRSAGRKRNNNSLAIVAVIVLTLACLGLLGVLVAVVKVFQ
ncbi:MAG: DUF4339 domain-containing protein, partial [Planctomycetales bacterium]|nr:DUF4339 domain-containing protein [Planctomycetales bacterium]